MKTNPDGACSFNALETMYRLSLEKQVRAALMEARVDPSLVLVDAGTASCMWAGSKKSFSEMEVVRGGL